MTPAGHEAMTALAELNHRVEDLMGFEREYRARLRAYFEDRLAELDAPCGTPPLRSAMLRIAAAPDAGLAEAVAELDERQRSRLLSVLLRVPVTEVAP